MYGSAEKVSDGAIRPASAIASVCCRQGTKGRGHAEADTT